MGWVPGTHGTSVQTAALVREWCGEEGCKLGSDSSWTNLLLTAPLLSHPPSRGHPRTEQHPGLRDPAPPRLWRQIYQVVARGVYGGLE